MPRWRQVIDENGKSQFVPIDEAAAKHDRHFVQGDIEPFISPIDNTLISDRKQYREHCKKHNVVPATEFSPEHYQRAAERRARLHTGQHTKEETFARRREMYEIAMQMERKNERRR